MVRVDLKLNTLLLKLQEKSFNFGKKEKVNSTKYL